MIIERNRRKDKLILIKLLISWLYLYTFLSTFLYRITLKTWKKTHEKEWKKMERPVLYFAVYFAYILVLRAGEEEGRKIYTWAKSGKQGVSHFFSCPSDKRPPFYRWGAVNFMIKASWTPLLSPPSKIKHTDNKQGQNFTF